MTNKTQIRTKRISFVLALSVITYTATDTYLSAYHDIDVMNDNDSSNTRTCDNNFICGLLHDLSING